MIMEGGDSAVTSLYEMIKQAFYKQPILPYQFQDIASEGKEDVIYNFFEDGLDKVQKEMMCLKLLDCIMALTDHVIDRVDLTKLLETEKLYKYVDYFMTYLHIYIDDEIIEEDKVYELAIDLATKSDHPEEVKLGILLLGLYEDDVAVSIIRVLALHSNFTLYAIEACVYYENYNSFLYDLVKNTVGYGKLAAIYSYHPMNTSQIEWLLEEGTKNTVLQHLVAMICLNKAECIKHYKNIKITARNFSKYSELLAYAALKEQIQTFMDIGILVKKYIVSADMFMNSFIDYAAVSFIKASMNAYWGEDYGEDEYYHWNTKEENEVRNVCIALVTNKECLEYVYQELKEPSYNSTLIMKVIKILGIRPRIKDFLPLLQRIPFDLEVMEYILVTESSYYSKYLFEELLPLFQQEVTTVCSDQLLEHEELQIGKQNRYDICLLYLLKVLHNPDQRWEEFCLLCLGAKYVEIRKEALKVLKRIQPSFSEQVRKRLSEAYEKEPNKKVKAILAHMIGKKNPLSKEHFVKVHVPYVDIHKEMSDQIIMRTYIAGAHEHEDVFLEMEAGDLICLVREYDNTYDSKSILITNQDGYVLGYVPQKDNGILAALIERGDTLYGILESELKKGKKPEILIVIQ